LPVLIQVILGQLRNALPCCAPDDRSSFFYGTYVSLTQPRGSELRSGKPTPPGFDCSGFVWWVLKHAGVPGSNVRWGATKQRDYANEHGTLVLCKPTGNDITKFGKPGDIVMFEQKGGATTVGQKGCVMSKINPHVGIYVGDGYLIESSGTRRVPPTDIDYTEFFKTYGTTNPKLYGGIQKRKVSPTGQYDSLVRYKLAPGADAVAFNAQQFDQAYQSAQTAVT
ncbi:NlpC/P60 family protein, partial [Nanoarchaeota archaeon]